MEKRPDLNEDDRTRSSDYSSQNGRNQERNDSSDVSPSEGRKIKLKIDLRLVVLVGFMYCVSLMDRTNLANAKVAGYAFFLMNFTVLCSYKTLAWRKKRTLYNQKPTFLIKASIWLVSDT